MWIDSNMGQEVAVQVQVSHYLPIGIHATGLGIGIPSSRMPSK